MKAISNRYTVLLLALSAAITAGCKKDENTNPVVASFTTEPAQVFTGDTVQFINGSENAEFYQWKFGDGTTSIEENPSHVYHLEGTYLASLTSIGSGDSDSVSREIEVRRSFDVTIFEGIGIEGADIHDSWSSVQTEFTSDTLYYVEYLADFEVYYHEVYYGNEGVAMVFYTENDTLQLQDSVMFMIIVPPYEGGTTKGIALGSSMQKVTIVYGDPENTIENQGTLGYWYDSKGVDFWSFDDSGIVDEIDIYDPADFAKKSVPAHRAVRDLVRNRGPRGGPR